MVRFDKIEEAYGLLLENVQRLQSQLHTHSYDALIEQNVAYAKGETADADLASNNRALRDLQLTTEEWRKTFQFLLMKLGQTEPLQANHQFTPESIAYVLLFLLEELTTKERLSVLELGSGTGLLAQFLLNHSQKGLTYLGIELDDLLIDLSASMAEIGQLPVTFVQGDAVRPQHLPECDVVISDLPIGYYPNDEVAQRYQVASSTEHTYVHHLFMDQALKYLKPAGLAVFLAPSNLLSSSQSDLLKGWLQDKAQLLSVIGLPDNLFAQSQAGKSIFVLGKKQVTSNQPFVYHLASLTNSADLTDFRENLKKWKQEGNISSENLL